MEKQERLFITLGGLFAALAVIAGAFGAHALADSVSPERLDTFRTGAFYHMVHALALVLVGAISHRVATRPIRVAGWLFVAGTLLFSGSLYMLVLADLPIMGAVTPLGGLSFISAWLLLAFGVWSAR